jgi:hypothetical protein
MKSSKILKILKLLLDSKKGYNYKGNLVLKNSNKIYLVQIFYRILNFLIFFVKPMMLKTNTILLKNE